MYHRRSSSPPTPTTTFSRQITTRDQDGATMERKAVTLTTSGGTKNQVLLRCRDAGKLDPT